MNENGQRLLELCLCQQRLRQDQASSQSALDTPQIKSLASNRLHSYMESYPILYKAYTQPSHRAGCDTNHSLVYRKVKLYAKKTYHIKTVGKPCLNVRKTCHAQKVEEFVTMLEKSLPDFAVGNA